MSPGEGPQIDKAASRNQISQENCQLLLSAICQIPFGVVRLVSYAPLWKTLRDKGFTTYTLINEYKISSRTIYNLKHNKGITLYTLERLCETLDCEITDVVKFVK